MNIVSKPLVLRLRRNRTRESVFVRQNPVRAILRSCFMVFVCATCFHPTRAQTTASQTDDATSKELKKLNELVEQNVKLEKQNRDLMEQIESLRRLLTRQAAGVATTTHSGDESATSASGVMPDTRTDRVGSSAESRSGGSASSEGVSTTPTTASSKADQQAPKAIQDPPSGQEYGRNTTWNLYEPGKGFDVAKTSYASLNISGYLVARYLNQLPPSQSFVDHNGQTQRVDTRQDFQLHRVMLYFTGNLFNPKFNYNITLWTVNDTAQQAIVGALYYSMNKHLLFGVGWNGLPGTRSMQGSHPYWPSYDRVMADEFFRPYFSQGVFAQGNLLPTLQYRWMVGNNNSNLDVPATKLDRDLSAAFAITWLPTTGQYGPRGAFGDYERHKKLATRFNLAYTF